jgi:glucose-6-phosphate dehydrogenase assembly protein OpcA
MEDSVIVDLENTTVSKVSKKIVQIREQGGVVALGRVLTLLIETDAKGVETSIKAANEASREHPCRIIVLTADPSTSSKKASLDAQIRVGGDAGASEVIVLRAYGKAAADPQSLVTGLLLPDAPIVVWWPGKAPLNPAESSIGKIATRRITDAASQADPRAHFRNLAKNYSPGDSDFAWTRLTKLRTQLATMLDQPPYDKVLSAEIIGSSDSPSVELLGAWLELKLRIKVKIVRTTPAKSINKIKSIRLIRKSGDVVISREIEGKAVLSQPLQPSREISLPVRSLRDCLSEDLRRLDPDDLFGEVITKSFGVKTRVKS